MIADPPTKTSLGVGFNANRSRSAGPEAWKQQMGTKQIPARLALLPEAKPNWNRLGLSAIVQFSILVFFVLVPLLYPESLKTALHFNSVELANPVTMVPVAPPPPPPPKVKAVVPKAVPPPPPIEQPKLNPQQPHIFADLTKPKPVQPKIQPPVEVKVPEVAPKFEAPTIDAKETARSVRKKT